MKYAEDLRAGDVIYDSWNELWGVVVDVDTKNEVCTYGSIDSKDRSHGISRLISMTWTRCTPAIPAALLHPLTMN